MFTIYFLLYYFFKCFRNYVSIVYIIEKMYRFLKQDTVVLLLDMSLLNLNVIHIYVI